MSLFHPQKRNRVEKPEAPPRAVKEEKRSSRRRSNVRRQRQKWEKEELEEIKEEEEAEAEMVLEYMDSDEEEKKKLKRRRTKEVENEEQEKVEEEQVSSSQVVLEQQEEEETYSVPPMQHWVPRTWKQDQGFSTLSFQQVELSSSSSSGAAPVRCTVLGRHGRSVFVGAPPTPLPAGKLGGGDQMAMVSPQQLQAHLRHLQGKLSTMSASGEGALRRSGRTKATRLQLQAAVTPWIGNLLLPSRRAICRAELLAAKWAEPPQLSTPFFRILLLVLRVDSSGCKDTIDNKKSRRWVQTTQARPTGSSPVRMMNPKTIGGMLQRRAMGVESQQRPSLNQPVVASGSTQVPRLLQSLPQPRPQVLLQFPSTVFLPPPRHQTPPTPSIRLLTPLAPPPLTSLSFPSPPPPLIHLLPHSVSVNHTPILYPVPTAPHTLSGVNQTGPAPRPLATPLCPAGGGNVKVVQGAAVAGAAGAEVVDGRRPRRLTAKARALIEATATKVTKVWPRPVVALSLASQ